MSLPPSVAASLGAPTPSAQPQRLAWVDVEDAPNMIEVLDPTSGAPLGWYAQHDDALGLTDQMAVKFRAVCDLVDQFECEAEGCQAGPEYTAPSGKRPGATIGWVLAGDADERTEWRAVTLVQRRRLVLAVCEDCSPTTVYESLRATEET